VRDAVTVDTPGAAYLIDFVFNPETWVREQGWELAIVEEVLRHDPARGTGLPVEWSYGKAYPYSA
jgi:hypothetical protein